MIAAMQGCSIVSKVRAQPYLRRLVWLAAGLSACFLGFALVSQYGFGLFPCELCLAQRKPYMAIIALGVVSCFVKRRRGLLVIAVLCTMLFFVDSGIAGYHAGVEQHIFKGPSACTANTEPQTLEEMRQALLDAELVSCDQPMAHFLGLSMAAWNAVVAFLSAVAMLLGILARKTKDNT